MADESVVDQIVKSLSFEVEAVPQGKNAQAAISSNMTPLNVKIRVRKKDKSDIEQGVLSVPKFGNPNSAPERIRLISSDQTIMSFNVVMEADMVKKAKKKPRKYFFGGCLGTQYDDDDDPYVPSITYSAKVTNTSTASKSDGVLKQNFTLLKNQMENTDDLDLPFNKKVGILGKCKPGGCLDPPFGEDNYKYSPVVKDDHSVVQIIEKKLKAKDQTQKYKDKKQHIVSLKSSKSSFPKKKDKDRLHDDSILSIFEADRLKDSLDTKCSDSIITYPPEASPSTNLNEKYLRNKISSEERQKKSISEGSDIFFSLSRKSNRQKEPKENKTLQESSSDGDTDKHKAALVFLRHIENVHEVPEDNLERFKKTSSPQNFSEATFFSQGTDTKNATKAKNIDKDTNDLSKKTGTKSGFKDSNDIDHNLLEKLPNYENNNNDGLHDVSSDTKSYSRIDKNKHYSENPSNMIVNDLDHKNANFAKSHNIKELKAISSYELKDSISRAIINGKNMKDDYKVADSTDLSMNKTSNMEIYDESSIGKICPFENTVIEETNNRYGNVNETMRLDRRTASSLSNELDDKKSFVESFRRDDELRTHEAESAKSTVISFDRIHNKRFKISQKSEEMDPTAISILDNVIKETPDGVISKKQRLLNNICDDEPTNYIRSDDLANNELEEKKLHIDMQNNKQNQYEAKSTFQSNEKVRGFIKNIESKEYAFPIYEQKDILDVVDKESKDFSSKQALESNVIGYPKLVPTFKVDEHKVLEDDNLITTPEIDREFIKNKKSKEYAFPMYEQKDILDVVDKESKDFSSKQALESNVIGYPKLVPTFKVDEYKVLEDDNLITTPEIDREFIKNKESKEYAFPIYEQKDILDVVDKESKDFSSKQALESNVIGYPKLVPTFKVDEYKVLEDDNLITTPKIDREFIKNKESKEYAFPMYEQKDILDVVDKESKDFSSKQALESNVIGYPKLVPTFKVDEYKVLEDDNLIITPDHTLFPTEKEYLNNNIEKADTTSQNHLYIFNNSKESIHANATYSPNKQLRDVSESKGAKRDYMFGSPSDALCKLEKSKENVSLKDFDLANLALTLETKTTKATYPSTKQPRDDLESPGSKRNDMFDRPSDALFNLERTGEHVSTRDFDPANSVSTLRTEITKETYPSTKPSKDHLESTGSKGNNVFSSPSDAVLKLERTGENVSTKDFDSANSVFTSRTKVTKETYPLINQNRYDSESTGSNRNDMFGSPSDALLNLERTGEKVSTKDFDSANSVSILRTKVTKGTYPLTKQSRDDSESTESKMNDMLGSTSDAFLKLERTGENVSTKDFDSANSVSTLRTKVTKGTYPSTKYSRDDSESTGSKRNGMLGSTSDAFLKLERTGENVSTKDFDSANSVSTLRTKVIKGNYSSTKQSGDDSESTGSKRNDMFDSPNEDLLNLLRRGESVSTKDFDSANSVSTLRTKVTKGTYPLTKQSSDDLESIGSKRNDNMFGSPSDALLKLERTGENISTKDFDSANSVSTLRTKVTKGTYPLTKQSSDDLESIGSKRNDMFGSPSDALLKLERTGENVSTKDFDSANSVSTLRLKVTKGTYSSTKQSINDLESTGSKRNDIFGSPSDSLLVLEKAEGRVSPNDLDSANLASTIRVKETKETPSTKQPRDDSESTGSKRDDMFGSPSSALLVLEKSERRVSLDDFDSATSTLVLETSATKATNPSRKYPRDDSESTGSKSYDMFSRLKDAHLMLGKTEESVSRSDFHSRNSASILGTTFQSHNEYHSRTTLDNITTTGLTSSRNSIIKENIILELGFQSYLNDKKERVLKSIDMSKGLVHQSNEIVTIIQSQIRPHLNDIIRVPIDSENEISIQIKRTKSPVRFQVQENGQFDHKPSMSKFHHGNGHAITPNIENKSYHEKSHSKITGVKLQRILSSMYEQDLIPLQKSIKYLKQDIELLSLQRNLCKDKAIGPKRSKPMRIFKVNQRCGCWKD